MAYLPNCPRCERGSDTIKRRHRNTAYVDEDMNYSTTCWECFQEEEEYWRERWEEYYAAVM